MSEKAQIENLLEQVQKLRDSVQVADRDAEFQQMEHDRSKALLERNVMERERDQARAELAKVKADVAWTMGALRISDMFRLRGSVEIPCAEEGWLPLSADPRDTGFIEWINKYGRAGIGQEHWIISIPHRLTTNEELPTIYNIRHILELCQQTAAA